MGDQTYLFVDGGHLRKNYTETMLQWSGSEGDLDLERVKQQHGANKCFYYDCVDDVRKPGEGDEAYRQRVAAQEERYNTIQRLHATHVRLGSMTGTGKKKRQKQVDILLAVDMMRHAARGNMSRAVLITGDQDFKPLVEALVDMGLHVSVRGHHRGTSRDLADAADHYQPMSLKDYWHWSSTKVQKAHPVPSKSIGDPGFEGHRLLRAGTINGKAAKLWHNRSVYVVCFPYSDSYMVCSFHDESRLVQFCELEFGDVSLDPPSAP
jgi:uncharacterized LabA/DUF88 family protein